MRVLGREALARAGRRPCAAPAGVGASVRGRQQQRQQRQRICSAPQRATAQHGAKLAVPGGADLAWSWVAAGRRCWGPDSAKPRQHLRKPRKWVTKAVSATSPLAITHPQSLPSARPHTHARPLHPSTTTTSTSALIAARDACLSRRLPTSVPKYLPVAAAACCACHARHRAV